MQKYKFILYICKVILKQKFIANQKMLILHLDYNKF